MHRCSNWCVNYRRRVRQCRTYGRSSRYCNGGNGCSRRHNRRGWLTGAGRGDFCDWRRSFGYSRQLRLSVVRRFCYQGLTICNSLIFRLVQRMNFGRAIGTFDFNML